MIDLNYKGHEFVLIQKFGLKHDYFCKICNIKIYYIDNDSYQSMKNFNIGIIEDILACDEYIIKEIIE
jgi:hypothetical protein